jgi:hypothetical protein
MLRIGANAFEHFCRTALRSARNSSRCQRDMVCGSAHIAFPLAGRSGAAAMALAGALR